jgi:hypothetical protein
LPFKSETRLVTRKAAPLLAFWPTPFKLTGQYWLLINLKTANALGLTVPLPLLGRADEVIE